MACILLIDDDALLREVLALALAQAGHTVWQAIDGQQGLEIFRCEPADIVITDIIMPDREGLETLMMLRSEQPQLPIIAMSGSATNSPLYLDMAAKLGARCVLTKPFPLSELLDAVAEILGENHGPGLPP